MSPQDCEKMLIDILSLSTGKNIKRGLSLRYLEIDSYGMRQKMQNALKERLGVDVSINSYSFNTIDQLLDYIIPIVLNNYSETVGEDKSDEEKSDEEKSEMVESLKSTNMSKKYEWAIIPDKNKHEYVIGIDFGHGETSAAYCSIGWNSTKGQLSPVKDIDFGSNTKVIPSAISITDDDKAYIGDTAFLPEILNKAQAHVCFKKKPQDINGESEKLMMRFMHEVYKTIKERNTALFTEGNHLVYIATPSGWNEEDKNLYGQMASNAGLPMGGITSESRAAFIKAQQDPDSGLPQYIDKGAIVFDMGSSTLDFTYLTSESIPTDWGDNCGASKIERIIYDTKREGDDEIQEFEKKYPNLVDALLFEARKAKEKVYFHPELACRITVNFDSIVDDEEFESSNIASWLLSSSPSLKVELASLEASAALEPKLEVASLDN